MHSNNKGKMTDLYWGLFFCSYILPYMTVFSAVGCWLLAVGMETITWSTLHLLLQHYRYILATLWYRYLCETGLFSRTLASNPGPVRVCSCICTSVTCTTVQADH